MTPKDKARELFNKYWNLLMIHEVKNRRLFTKQCALICVDEIQDTFKNGENEILYWEEVKQEIIKL